MWTIKRKEIKQQLKPEKEKIIKNVFGKYEVSDEFDGKYIRG